MPGGWFDSSSGQWSGSPSTGAGPTWYYGEAESAAVLDAQEDAFVQQAEAYCLSRELDIKSKMAKGRINVIVDFLAYSAGPKDVPTVEVPAVDAGSAPPAF